MPYLDRLRNCTYTDPAGTVHALSFDDVTREGVKKIGAFALPQQDRAEIQDLGMDGIDYPMTVYIAGEDYDLAADAFWSGLSLRHTDAKPGLLSHPTWGDLTVKPLTFTESRGFVEGMGRAVFVVQFKQVDPTAKFPATSANAGAQIATLSESTASTAIMSFLGPTTASDIAIVTDQATSTINSLRNQLASVVAVSDDLAAALDSGCQLAVDSVNELIEAPETMATTLVGLMRIPASAAGSVSSKILAYETLFSSLSDAAGFRSDAENEFLSLSLSASALAAAEAATAGDLANRPDAVAASDTMGRILAAYRSMMDQTGVDPDLIRQTTDLVSMAQAYLLEASFGLKSARRKYLERNSNPITVTFELYGTVAELDRFISDNALNEDEFFVLPMGREVVWYE